MTYKVITSGLALLAALGALPLAAAAQDAAAKEGAEKAAPAPPPGPSEAEKKAAKLDKGSAKPHSDKVGKLTRAQVEEIAKTKLKDLTAANLDAAVRTIAGSARSMGVTVEGV